MATIRFDKAGVFSWENTYDELVEEAMSDPSDIATVVSQTIDSIAEEKQEQVQGLYAGDVDGAHGPVGMYIYTMEDDDWIYVAHFIYEVEYQCFLFRHRKQKQGETFGVTESAVYYDKNGM